MRISSVYKAFFGLILSAWAAMPWAASQLNGLAAHQELGSEQFIGALYLEATSDDRNIILAADGSKRMELRITSDNGIAARRFTRMWIEGMAINNTSAVLTDQADNMVRFSNAFKGKLQKNDTVTLSMEPGEGVDITLNGVVLDTINDHEFFNLLLRTWIGNVPLSSTFRANLLRAGSVDAGLRSRFEAIAPTEQRREAILAWTQPEEPETPEDETPQRQRTAERTPTPDTRPRIAAVTPLDIPRPELNADPEDIAEPEPEPKPQRQAQQTPTPPPTAAREEAEEEEEDEDEGPLITVESLRAQQVYFSDLMRSIQSNTRYPRRALQRDQQGEVRISVIINRSGEIVRTELLEDSGYRLINNAALDAINGSELVISLTPYANASTRAYSRVILPMASFAETSGSYVNAEGRCQSFQGAGKPLGESRPGWKVLRVLGNAFQLPGFDYMDSRQVLDEVLAECAHVEPHNLQKNPDKFSSFEAQGLLRVADVPIYAVDAVVRRARALQQTPLMRPAAIYINPASAHELGIAEASKARVRQQAEAIVLPLILDQGIPQGCVWIPAGLAETSRLGPAVGPVEITAA
jgi:TonB family protein